MVVGGGEMDIKWIRKEKEKCYVRWRVIWLVICCFWRCVMVFGLEFVYRVLSGVVFLFICLRFFNFV